MILNPIFCGEFPLIPSVVYVVVKGTTEALAVTMQLRDDSDNIIAMITAGTTSGAFDISLNNLSLTPGTSYTVYVADYEGGLDY